MPLPDSAKIHQPLPDKIPVMWDIDPDTPAHEVHAKDLMGVMVLERRIVQRFAQDGRPMTLTPMFSQNRQTNEWHLVGLSLSVEDES